jgi:lipoate-protein ligase A
MAGISDLTYKGSKISGNAQQRKRTHLLHHGTILYAFDLAVVSRYLRLPVRQPAYRANRTHHDFLVNLPQSRMWLRDRLIAAWQAEAVQATWRTDLVTQLVAEKYARPEWNERR